VILQGQQIIEEGAANRFVDGIMTPNVLSQDDQVAREVENSGSVNSTGSREIALSAPNTFGQFQKFLHFETDRIGGINWWKLLADKFDAFLSAESATRGDRAETLGRGRGEFCRRSQRDIENVAERSRKSAPGDFSQIGARAQNSFGEKEAGREFFVVSGRPHGYRECLPTDPDFERLFDRDLIGHVIITAVRSAPNNATGADPVFFRI